MRALVLALLAAGCGNAVDRGYALELTLQPGCADPLARIRKVRFTVDATPPVSPNTLEHSGSQVFAGYPAPNRLVLLFPAGTSRVKVSAVALGDNDAMIGGGMTTDDIFWNAPALRSAQLVISETTCSMPFDLGGSGFDLRGAAPDLAGDLAGVAPSVSSIEARGAFVDEVYEGEGNQQAKEAGVAVLMIGSGFRPDVVVSSDFGPAGPAYVNPSGTVLATSLSLSIDTALGAGDTRNAMITLAQGGASTTVILPVKGLAEITVPSGLPAAMSTPSNAPLIFSKMIVDGTLQIGGSSRAFLWVTGPLTGTGSIIAQQTAGGRPGCGLTDICDNRFGFGHGENAELALVNSGSGASYGTLGNGGAGGAQPGILYGDPSLIGLIGGSGGGSGGGAESKGGAGGGVLRVVAGKITDVSFRADGENGHETPSNGGGGGGGSGGSVLIQTAGGISGRVAPQSLVSSAGGSGGMGVGGTSFPGGNGGHGRLRVDTGVALDAVNYLATNGVGFRGAMIAADWPSAWSAPPAEVKVVCGKSTSFVVEVDDVVHSATTNCISSTVTTVMVPFSPPVAGASRRRICIRVVPTSPSSSPPPVPIYAAPYEENRNCRSIAVAGN